MIITTLDTMDDIKSFAFKHHHGERELITPFDPPAQRVLKTTLGEDHPVAVVRHLVKHGEQAGTTVYFRVCFADRTVTKCDSKGVPIPAKWRGAPEGATYTHELIYERTPEPQPQPAAAGGGGGHIQSLLEIADSFSHEFMATARKVAAHTAAADVYGSRRMYAAAEPIVQAAQEEVEELITTLRGYLTMAAQELNRKPPE